ncbi:MAG: hypothetical protein Kow0081_0340 [Candidatus Dojkabacteria bacterium]
MEYLILIGIGINAVLLAFVVFKLVNKRDDSAENTKTTIEEIRRQEEKLENTRREIQQLLMQQNELMQKQLNENNKTMQQNFAISQKTIAQTQKETSEIVRTVTEKLVTIEKTNSQILDFSKQMESLEKILKNPKQRGVLGEYFLETTLKNVLPPESFQMQYKFQNGEIVDAVVFVKDKIIPIDAKFSLENYNRIVAEEDPVVREKYEKDFKNDLKNRIDETAKYIRESENTMDFAFMFIPSEGIYYDLLVNKVGAIQVNTRDLISYAFVEKKVIIVSPTSFLAYLQTVLQGLRALKIEESAQQIRENVRKLVQHLRSYEENFEKVGKHLQTTVNFYNKSNKEFKKIDKDVLKITGDESLQLLAEDVEIE